MPRTHVSTFSALLPVIWGVFYGTWLLGGRWDYITREPDVLLRMSKSNGVISSFYPLLLSLIVFRRRNDPFAIVFFYADGMGLLRPHGFSLHLRSFIFRGAVVKRWERLNIYRFAHSEFLRGFWRNR